MKVEHTNPKHISQTTPKDTSKIEEQRNLKKQANAIQGVEKQDKAAFSQRARLMAKARKAYDAIPEVRKEKIDDLKNKVRSGDYEVDYDALSKTLQSRLYNNRSK